MHHSNGCRSHRITLSWQLLLQIIYPYQEINSHGIEDHDMLNVLKDVGLDALLQRTGSLDTQLDWNWSVQQHSSLFTHIIIYSPTMNITDISCVLGLCELDWCFILISCHSMQNGGLFLFVHFFSYECTPKHTVVLNDMPSWGVGGEGAGLLPIVGYTVKCHKNTPVLQFCSRNVS